MEGCKMPDLNDQFNGAMFTIYQRAKAEAKYTATIFLNMLNARGGLATAKFLINAADESKGYTELYLRKRLDLTVEAMVVARRTDVRYLKGSWHETKGRPDFQYTPWSPERRAAASKAARARAKAVGAKSVAKGQRKNAAARSKPKAP
jgi:hypothetical protein